MDNLATHESTLRQLAAKPIAAIRFEPKSVRVAYEDGFECTVKWDAALRLFLCTLQDVRVRRTPAATPDCIWIPLGHFVLLGWTPGECVVFERDQVKLVIGFS